MIATSGGLDVLILAQYYRPEPIGSAPYCADLAEWLAADGARVDVLTNRPYYPDTQVLPPYRDGARDREELGGVSVMRLTPLVPQRGGVVERLRADLAFFVRGLAAHWRRRIPRRQFIVSFCPSVFTVLLARVIAGRHRRHIAVVHDIQSGLAEGLGFPGAWLFAQALRWLEGFVLNRADAIVVLSAEMGRQIERLGVERPIVVLPIWVDPQAVHPLPDDPARPPTLLYSGNLGRKQGLPIVLDLAERVARRRSDVRVLVRGAGYQADALIAEARARNLRNVAFAPLVGKDKLSEGLAEGDVHLVPQDPNAADFALPSKVYSIMAAARPMVATARPGSSLWRLAEETAAVVCVAPDDAEAFAAAALDLLGDRERCRKLGLAGRRYAEQVAARDVVLARYRGLIFGDR
ncbi:MAG: glycosyltransferase [Alphaproteobacteria bacterium]|nr:glycosyltransferase [Alphaproteobacteria bacterium]